MTMYDKKEKMMDDTYAGIYDSKKSVKGASKKKVGITKKAKEVKEQSDHLDDTENLEICSYRNNVLVKPYAENPYSKVCFNEVGLITKIDKPVEKKSEETGELEEQRAEMICAKVVDPGFGVVGIEAGDDVFYTVHSQTPIPFFGLGFQSVDHGRILAVVNKGLAERFKKYGERGRGQE